MVGTGLEKYIYNIIQNHVHNSSWHGEQPELPTTVADYSRMSLEKAYWLLIGHNQLLSHGGEQANQSSADICCL